jgi:hypothetical protein
MNNILYLVLALYIYVNVIEVYNTKSATFDRKSKLLYTQIAKESYILSKKETLSKQLAENTRVYKKNERLLFKENINQSIALSLIEKRVKQTALKAGVEIQKIKWLSSAGSVELTGIEKIGMKVFLGSSPKKFEDFIIRMSKESEKFIYIESIKMTRNEKKNRIDSVVVMSAFKLFEVKIDENES